MRAKIIFAALVLSNFTVAFAAPLLLPPTDLQRFAGEVKAVDRSARTITFEMPMRFVFHVRNETKISARDGAALKFDNIKAGDGADVVARHGKDNTWAALTVKLLRGDRFPDFISARTIQGKTISGPNVGNFIRYEPPGELVNRDINFGQQSGLFLLTVRPDGSVANVRPVKPLSYAELNERASKWLMNWRFHPNSVTEVRVPININSFRRY